MMPNATAIAEKTKAPKITREFSEAFDLLENTQQNVFLTGKVVHQQYKSYFF